MTRYAIIILAVAVGAAIGLVLARRRRRKMASRRAADATLVEARPFWHTLLPWLGGLAVLLAGLLILADHDRAPKGSEYRPATIDGDSDGVNPGGFGDAGQ